MEDAVLNYKNLRLEQEFANPVYNVFGKAISATAKKHKYGKFDVVRLIDALYGWDYAYLTNDDDYRMQVRMLDEYFTKEYKHRLITFELVKTINDLKGSEAYDIVTSDVALLDATIKNGKKSPATDLCLISDPLEQNNYDKLMRMIENDTSLRHSVALIYDKIISKEK